MMYNAIHEETRAVKEALKAAGIRASVGHGTGFCLETSEVT